MDPQIAIAVIGLIGVIVGSVLTGGAALYIQRSSNKALEVDELRKRRVAIIYDLFGSRYVLNADYKASSSEVQVFNTSMALVSVYFSNDADVIAAYDKLMNTKNDDNLLNMLRIAAKKHAGLDSLDTHLKRVMTVNAER